MIAFLCLGLHGDFVAKGTGHGFFGTTPVDSNEDSETVTAIQNPALSLTKSASPTVYSSSGQVITYTYTIRNSGNVTLSGPFMLSDDHIGSPLGTAFTCGSGPLAPNATTTCTASYSITAADMTVFSVTNTAVATTSFNGNTVASNQAHATINRHTAAMLPTQTTCQQYAAGPSAWPTMYDAFTYQVKANKINSVSPGVIFYYNTISAPSASFTLNVVQTNDKGWKPMLIQGLGQAILFDANCNKASGVIVTTTLNPYTVTFTVSGATLGAIYYIGIKYSPQNLIGQSVTRAGGVYPTSLYSFSTVGYAGGATSIPVIPKR